MLAGRPCGSRIRSRDRWTRKQLENLAAVHNIRTARRNMDSICADLQNHKIGAAASKKKPAAPIKGRKKSERPRTKKTTVTHGAPRSHLPPEIALDGLHAYLLEGVEHQETQSGHLLLTNAQKRRSSAEMILALTGLLERPTKQAIAATGVPGHDTDNVVVNRILTINSALGESGKDLLEQVGLTPLLVQRFLTTYEILKIIKQYHLRYSPAKVCPARNCRSFGLEAISPSNPRFACLCKEECGGEGDCLFHSIAGIAETISLPDIHLDKARRAVVTKLRSLAAGQVSPGNIADLARYYQANDGSSWDSAGLDRHISRGQSGEAVKLLQRVIKTSGNLYWGDFATLELLAASPPFRNIGFIVLQRPNPEQVVISRVVPLDEPRNSYFLLFNEQDTHWQRAAYVADDGVTSVIKLRDIPAILQQIYVASRFELLPFLGFYRS